MRRPRPLTYDVPRGLSTGLGDWEVGSKLKDECCTSWQVGVQVRWECKSKPTSASDWIVRPQAVVLGIVHTLWRIGLEKPESWGLLN